MPFGIQPTHLILILVVALLVFGPSRLPEIGRSFGSMLREFQTATKEATQGFQEGIATTPVKKEEPPTVATVPCKSCGKALQVGSKFCPECGASQLAAPPPAQVQIAPQPAAAEPAQAVVATPPSAVEPVQAAATTQPSAEEPVKTDVA